MLQHPNIQTITMAHKKNIYIKVKNTTPPTGSNNANKRNKKKNTNETDPAPPAIRAPLEVVRICCGVFQNQKRGNHPNNIHQRKGDI